MCVSLAVTKLPSASTTSADSRLSIVRPYSRGEIADAAAERQPPTPVDEMKPLGTARPNACVAWSTSPQSQPPPT
jgi:hypothetical protein